MLVQELLPFADVAKMSLKQFVFSLKTHRLSLEGTVVDAVVSVRLGAVVQGKVRPIRYNDQNHRTKSSGASVNRL